MKDEVMKDLRIHVAGASAFAAGNQPCALAHAAFAPIGGAAQRVPLGCAIQQCFF